MNDPDAPTWAIEVVDGMVGVLVRYFATTPEDVLRGPMGHGLLPQLLMLHARAMATMEQEVARLHREYGQTIGALKAENRQRQEHENELIESVAAVEQRAVERLHTVVANHEAAHRVGLDNERALRERLAEERATRVQLAEDSQMHLDQMLAQRTRAEQAEQRVAHTVQAVEHEREWCAKTAEQSIDAVPPGLLAHMDAHRRLVTEVNNGTAQFIAQMIRMRTHASTRQAQVAHWARRARGPHA
jgi:hypothetical protein